MSVAYDPNKLGWPAAAVTTVLAPPVAGVLLWDNSLWACVAVLGFTGLFFGSYGLAFLVLRRLPRHLIRLFLTWRKDSSATLT